jgi:uncharacterized membrane protein YoaK (UPF0700 family)
VVHDDRRLWGLATAWSALAGYVDALSYLNLGGFFVSFMSGNSTRVGVGLATVDASAMIAAVLVAGFVAGVIAGSLVAQRAGAWRRPAVFGLATALLTLAAACTEFGWTRGAVAAMLLAMGAENAVFERSEEVSIGLTYVTGTLVKLGQRLAAALLGGARWAWVPYLLMWVGLVCGGVVGALVYPRMGLRALWAGAGAAALLTLMTALIDRPKADAPGQSVSR